MFRSIADFEQDWLGESRATLNMLQHLTDASLAQRVTPEGRSLGQIAWHMVQSMGEMMARTGLAVAAPAEEAPVPATAEEIVIAYGAAAESLLAEVRARWSDASLLEEDNIFGDTWARGFTQEVLLRHQAHHRGQLSVLMRQAGLPVPGVCGPSREEWAAWGLPTIE